MSGQPRRLLGDIIAEKQAQTQTSCNYFIIEKIEFLVCVLADNDLDPRISSMYEQVGQILSQYRSGKIPKAFKILPNLANWEQVNDIFLMSNRSNCLFFRCFSSHNQIDGRQHLCIKPHDYLLRIWTLKWLNGIFHLLFKLKFIYFHRFYNIILLPRIRDDIDEYKKLNFQLYMVKFHLLKK
jgi:essential nuclear protein 1